jgi:hypothetical protein
MAVQETNREIPLSFGKMIYWDHGIFEIIPSANTEINLHHINEIKKIIGLQSPGKEHGFLVNRRYSYYHAFSVIQMIDTFETIRAVAVLAETRKSYIRSKTVVESFQSVSKDSSKFRLFRDRREAMNWLSKKLADV